eukprot:CAMPEP_0197024670 /NCGR_PEP_ID=MMETSP1384-20130603/5180_1 /TAXON_ID=29189 /ORGANISM="Ammonia sp." /LENGTH=525 /DNA_ID=CAMNT_0042453091 /DNA_START=45 /DNA_END=1619 /DNA_ORIENTATION=-
MAESNKTTESKPQQTSQIQGQAPMQQQMQGYPAMQQQQQQQQQMQGYPPMQQQMQGYPVMQQQMQQQYQVPQLQQQINPMPQGLNMNNLNMNYNAYQQMPSFPSQQYQQLPSRGASGSGGFRLLRFAEDANVKDASKLKLAALIITICDGSTYDSLFSTVKQDAGEGSRVSVYQCGSTSIDDLIKCLEASDTDDSQVASRKDDLKLLLADLSDIEDPSCVAINYECCSGCNDAGFSNMDNKRVIEQLIFFLSKGYLVMYSDFSLKAILTSWNDAGNETKLGPNPLVRTGQYSATVKLHFNPYVLKTCVSSQLQAVGELCPNQDYCTCHCMGGTVQYSLDKEFKDANQRKDIPYTVEVLTIADFPKHGNSCSIQVPDFGKLDKDESKTDEEIEIEVTKLPLKTLYGDAGHVVLDYGADKDEEAESEKVTEEGGKDEAKENDDEQGQKEKKVKARKEGELFGKVLFSMTHWCELVKLGDNVNDDVLFKVAAKNLGTESVAYQQMQAEYMSMGGKQASGAQLQQQQAW